MAESASATCTSNSRDLSGGAQARHGGEDGSVTFRVLRVPVRRPRLRAAAGSEALLVLPLTCSPRPICSGGWRRTGCWRRSRPGATRSVWSRSVKPVGAEVTGRALSTSKSALSRRLVKATDRALGELPARDPSGLELVALMLHEVDFGEQLTAVALGTDIGGGMHRPIAVEWATEHPTALIDPLARLFDCGWDVTRPILVVIDSTKTLPTAVDAGFDRPIGTRYQRGAASHTKYAPGPPRGAAAHPVPTKGCRAAHATRRPLCQPGVRQDGLPNS